MPYFIISLIVQITAIVHCVRTGRNTIWIWVILFLPFAGALAYLIAEVLPEMFGSRAARRTVRNVRQRLDPERELRDAERASRGATDIASRQRYADELVRQNRPGEAVSIYRLLLTGLYQFDPSLMLGLARAQFAQRDFAAVRATLDELIAKNPDFKSHEGHLLYARSLEELGDVDAALHEYAALAPGFPGAEPTVRLARLLKIVGRQSEARQLLRELLDRAEQAPAHYRKAQREWLDEAAKEAR